MGGLEGQNLEGSGSKGRLDLSCLADCFRATKVIGFIAILSTSGEVLMCPLGRQVAGSPVVSLRHRNEAAPLRCFPRAVGRRSFWVRGLLI